MNYIEQKKYENLDGLRAYACIGIVLMHVLDNGGFGMKGFVFETFILSFTNFSFLFMILSSFSICCGYYERFQNNTVSMEEFYKRRYQRIWPYFALLCTLELIIDHSLKSLYEWFADLTLTFGLIPNNNIEVVGVGWFIGLVFVFYMVFPFFVFLMKDKKRAWLVLVVSILLHLLCTVHFTGTGGRVNIIYSGMFFVAGGVIYLYREELVKIRMLAFVFLIAGAFFYYTVSYSGLVTLIVFASMAVVAICFDNKLIKYLFQNKLIMLSGSISMEIYLCHMFVFRMLERLKLLSITRSDLINYLIVSIATITGAIIMAFVFRQLIDIVQKNSKTA